MSQCLADRSLDHVVLERGEVANSWRTERWDSLRLLTPNWQSRLPGFHPDYSWLHVPVLDRKGRIRHDGGVVEAPGMYLMGIQFLRRRKSALIDGAGDDARDLSDHLASYLDGRVTATQRGVAG